MLVSKLVRSYTSTTASRLRTESCVPVTPSLNLEIDEVVTANQLADLVAEIAESILPSGPISPSSKGYGAGTATTPNSAKC